MGRGGGTRLASSFAFAFCAASSFSFAAAAFRSSSCIARSTTPCTRALALSSSSRLRGTRPDSSGRMPAVERVIPMRCRFGFSGAGVGGDDTVDGAAVLVVVVVVVPVAAERDEVEELSGDVAPPFGVSAGAFACA